MRNPFTRDRLAELFTAMEQTETEPGLPNLYTLTCDTATNPIRLNRTEIGPWAWTRIFFGIGPDGATGNTTHDLALYASRAEPMPGFLAAILRYTKEADDENKPARVLLAVDHRGDIHQVTQHEGDTTAAHRLIDPEEDEHGQALTALADKLRGEPAVREYAFDVKLLAVARIKATSTWEATALLNGVCDIQVGTVAPGVEIFNANLDGIPNLVEIDGHDPA